MNALKLVLLMFFMLRTFVSTGQSDVQDTVSLDNEVKIFEVVDVNPQLIGGFKEIYLWISKNLDISDLVQMDTLKCIGSFSCKVYIQFTVTEEGKMIDFDIAKEKNEKHSKYIDFYRFVD